MARTSPNDYSSITLGTADSVSYYFNKYVGGQVEIGIHPDGNNDGASSAIRPVSWPAIPPTKV